MSTESMPKTVIWWGVGLVMRYVDHRLRGDRIADRPSRWRFPSAEEADR